MNTKTPLMILGCGDIGCRLWREISAELFAVTGVRRNSASLPAELSGVSADFTRYEDVVRVLQLRPAILVLTFTPSNRSDQGYQQGYVRSMENVLRALNATGQRPFVLLVSSTRVYGEGSGERVDEQTPALPQDQAGRYLLEMENLLRGSGLPCTVVRAAGIYGAGRRRLLNLLLSGQAQAPSYSNRIHADDLARLLAWLIERYIAGKSVPELLLAVDSAPALLPEIQAWLAQQTGMPMPAPVAEAKPHKRCSNERLLALGFELRYPSYREGYGALLSEERGR